MNEDRPSVGLLRSKAAEISVSAIICAIRRFHYHFSESGVRTCSMIRF